MLQLCEYQNSKPPPPSLRRQRRQQQPQQHHHQQQKQRMTITYCIFFLICIQTGFAQLSDDVYIVQPTPALRLNNQGDLTTVLLLNNNASHHHGNGRSLGRHLNVKPTVGLLTSTARTFIQEGVTTEYATQVLGTTLDNGRLYAQLLKKSSRVLYDKDTTPQSLAANSIQPTAKFPGIVSQLQTYSPKTPKSLLQSHNDIIGDKDWQLIDDHLLLVNRGDAVGRNGELVISPDSPPQVQSSLIVFPATKSDGKSVGEADLEFINQTFSVSHSSSSSSSSPQLFGNGGAAGNIAAQKVLHAANLPTYTIKNVFAPSGFSWDSPIDDDFIYDGRLQTVSKLRGEPMRTAKLLHQQQQNQHKSILNSALRNMATVTYYGFAEFTTIVGDTVIVFSPSTAAELGNHGQVTSIKGEATLNGAKQATAFVTHVPITVTQDLIEPTFTMQHVIGTTLGGGGQRSSVDREVFKYHSEFTMPEDPDDYSNGDEEVSDEEYAATTEQESVEESTTQNLSGTGDELESSIISIDDGPVATKSLEESSSTAAIETLVKPTLRKPSNEDISKIFASLASVEAAKKLAAAVTSAAIEIQQLPETTEVSETTTDAIAEITDSDQTTESEITTENILANEVSTEQAEVENKEESVPETIPTSPTSKVREEFESSDKSIEPETKVSGGVTTIFFEDDPFQAFEVTPTQSMVAVATLTDVPSTTDFRTLDETTTVEPVAAEEEITTELQEPSSDSQPSEDYAKVEEAQHAAKLNCEQKTSEIVPTLVPKTLTYLTTFFISDSEQTSTSIESNVVVTFDVSYLTQSACGEDIKPTQVASEPLATVSEAVEVAIERPSHSKEVQFNESIQTEDATDVITTARMIVTEKVHVTTEQQPTTTNAPLALSIEEETTTEKERGVEEESRSEEEIELIYKTLYTTYTYLTTFFHESTTSVSSRKEIITNVMTSTVSPSSLLTDLDAEVIASIAPSVRKELSDQAMSTEKSVVQQSDLRQIDDILREDEGQVGATATLDDKQIQANGVKTYYTTYTYFTTIFVDGETEITSRTEVYTNYVSGSTESVAASNRDDEKLEYTVRYDDNNVLNDITPTQTYKTIQRSSAVPVAVRAQDVNNPGASVIESSFSSSSSSSSSSSGEITMITDVQSSSSDGDRQAIENINKNGNGLLEDQISSESNTDEILPSSTLLLQTSYTTFTYFTTMYIGNTASSILSRLETITNVVTETLQPTQMIKADDSTLPITYFTTFTYWTTLYKDGEITTISREETVSNIITPTATLTVDTTKTVQPAFIVEPIDGSSGTVGSIVAVNASSVIPTAVIATTQVLTETMSNDTAATVIVNAKPVMELTTFYTTYTYFTTQYVSDQTVIDSRFETVTNVNTPMQFTDATVSGVTETLTDTKIEPATVKTAVATENPIIGLNQGKIVDAEGISTLYYTTRTIATTINDQPTTVVESSTSLNIDQVKKALSSATETDHASRTYKTGLVRLIDGTMVANQTTTLYQSKVIGTVIDGRYAQIIESTSSFLIEKTLAPSTSQIKITPTAVHGPSEGAILQTAFTPIASTSVVEGSISDDDTDRDSQPPTTGEDDGGEAEEDDDDESAVDENGRQKSRLTFQSKRKTFTPVIRPFASRNRPQFAPKRKSGAPGSATIITRSDFTPTITATPALKSESSRGRFSSNRKSSSANLSSGAVSGSSRKFSRNRSSSTGFLSSSSYTGGGGGSSRRGGFASSRIQPTGVFGASSRRGPSSQRAGIGSSNLGRAGISSAFPANSRLRIKPTATVIDSQLNTNAYTTQEPDASDENATQLNGENGEINHSEFDETVDTTTESSRRQNPLLKFRRPSLAVSRSPNVSQRRNPLTQRAKTTTTTTTTTAAPKPRPRAFQRPSIAPFQNRARPQNSLFPPRGLFKPQTINDDLNESKKQQQPGEEGTDFADDIDGEEYDDDEDGDDGELDRNRRDNGSRRTKRQAPSFRSRFRRPTSGTARAEEKIDRVDEEPVSQRSRTTARYSGARTNNKKATQAKSSGNSRIRPTKASSSTRAQFTLREKDTATKTSRSSNFRRPTTNGLSSSRRTATTISRPKAPRLKSYANAVTESTYTSRSTVGRSRQTTSRGRSTTRSRGTTEYKNIDPILPAFDGTITVTHHVPTEVTIPVVNGKVTEYKNIITAQIRTEVLAPNQYNTLVDRGGSSLLVLAREESTVNGNGATEVTQFILHETPTTSVIFTPTTIRGRRTSFSHIIPSTVYDVENVVSTIQPQIAAQAPLANILLSQLLLGNIGLPQQQINPLIGLGGQQAIPGAATIPTTEFKTRSTTYVTTVTDAMSTVIPITFRGKEILTTIFDSSVNVITATEFITDTIVVTPTMGAVQQVNSLLLPLLLQQQQQQQQGQGSQPLLPLQNTALPQQLGTDPLLLNNVPTQQQQQQALFQDSNIRSDLELNRIQKVNLDDFHDARETEEFPEQEAFHDEATRPRKRHHRKNGRNAAAALAAEAAPSPTLESSVVTLYVSGRRPGEFSTVLSTVVGQDSSLRKRHITVPVEKSAIVDYGDLYDADESEIKEYLLPTTNDVAELTASTQVPLETQSLESIIDENRNSPTPTLDDIGHVTDVELPLSHRKTLDYDERGRFFNLQPPFHQSAVINPTSVISGDEARYNLATRVMSNGVEVIVAGDKSKTAAPHRHSVLRIMPSNLYKPMTLAPSTLKNQMILIAPTDSKENLTLPINPNQFVTKTCLTTYTYRTTYLQDGTTTIESREKVISNIATEERNYLKISPTSTSGITLSRTPEFAIGVFHTTYTYLNTILDGELPIVLSSKHTVINTITGPEDYISFLQPSEEATPIQETNTYYSKITFTKTIHDTNIEKIVSTSNILTQVVITESLPSKSTSVMTSYIALDATDVDRDSYEAAGKDVHIYATKTYLTTFTYFTTVLKSQPHNSSPSTGVNSHIRVVENVITESIPNHMLKQYDLDYFRQQLQLTSTIPITAMATLIGGQTLQVTAMNMLTPYVSQMLQAAEPADGSEKGSSTISPPSFVEISPSTPPTQPTAESQIKPLNSEAAPETDHDDDDDDYGVAGDGVKDEENVVDDIEVASSNHEDHVYNSVDYKPRPVKNSTKINDKDDFQVSNLIGSLNFNGLNALGPVINAMAGLIQTNFGAAISRRNVTHVKPLNTEISSKNLLKNITSAADSQTVSLISSADLLDYGGNLQHSPIYIPVRSTNDGLEADTRLSSPASLHIAPPKPPVTGGAHQQKFLLESDEKANRNNKLEPLVGKLSYETPLLNGGIPISPGEVITANSDVIIGKPNGIRPRIPFPNSIHEQVDFKPPLLNRSPQQQHLQQQHLQQQHLQQQHLQQQHLQQQLLQQYQQQHQQQQHQQQQHQLQIPASSLIQHYQLPAPISPKLIPLRPYHHQNYNMRPPPPPPSTSGGYKPQYSYPPEPGTQLLPLRYPGRKPQSVLGAASSQSQYVGRLDAERQQLLSNEIIEIKRIPEVFSTDLPAFETQNVVVRNTEKPMLVNIQPSKLASVMIPHGNTAPVLIIESNAEPHKNGQYFDEPAPYPNTVLGVDSQTVQHHSHGAAGIEQTVQPDKPEAGNTPIQVNLDASVLSHNIDLHVPPITFTKDNEFPHSTPVHGQTTVNLHKNGHLTGGSYYNPHLTVVGQKHPYQSSSYDSYAGQYQTQRYRVSGMEPPPSLSTLQLGGPGLPPKKYLQPRPNHTKFHPHPVYSLATPHHYNNFYVPYNKKVNGYPPNQPNLPPRLQHSATSLPIYDNLPIDHSQAPSIADQITDEHREDDYENEEGEVIQESNSLPVIPGQYIDYPTTTPVTTSTTDGGETTAYRIPPFLNMPSASAINELNHIQMSSTNISTNVSTTPPFWSQPSITPATTTAKSTEKRVTSVSPPRRGTPNSERPTRPSFMSVGERFKMPSNSSSSSATVTGQERPFTSAKPALRPTFISSGSQFRKPLRPPTDTNLYSNAADNLHAYVQVSLPIDTPKDNFTQSPGPIVNSSQTERPFNVNSYVKPISNNSILSNDMDKDSSEIFDYKESINPHNLGVINNLDESQLPEPSIDMRPPPPVVRPIASLPATTEEVMGMSPPPLPTYTTLKAPMPFPSLNLRKPQRPPPLPPGSRPNTTRASPTTEVALTVEQSVVTSAGPTLAPTTRYYSTVKRLPPTHSWTKEPATTPISSATKPIRLSPGVVRKPSMAAGDQAAATVTSTKTSSSSRISTTKVRLPSLVLTTRINHSHPKNDSDPTTISPTPSVKLTSGNNSTNSPDSASIPSRTAADEMFNAEQAIPDDILITGSESPILSPDSHHTTTTATTTTYIDHTQTVTVTKPVNVTTRTRLVSKIVLPTKYQINTKTLTVTSTKTTVLTSEGLPSTQTLILTTTQTSTIVNHVTETQTEIQTLLQPTKVTSHPSTQIYKTVTAASGYTPPPPHNPEKEPTPPDDFVVVVDSSSGEYVELTAHGAAMIPSPSTTLPPPPAIIRKIPANSPTKQRNNGNQSTVADHQHDSIFVVMTDQKNSGLINLSGKSPPSLNIIGDGDRIDGNGVTEIDDAKNDSFDLPDRDEDTVNGESNHVLLGGILIATPSKAAETIECRPDCKASRNEVCQRLDGHMRCICRAGFARMFPDRPCKPTYTYQLNLPLYRFGKELLVYDESLANKESEGFFNLAGLTHEAVDRMVMQSDFRDIYHGVHVTGFYRASDGKGIIGKFYLQLSDNSDEQRLIDVFRKYLRSTNYSIGGTELYSTQREAIISSGHADLQAADFDECLDRQFHDCSDSAHCFNLHGTYTCSCKEGYADLSENPMYPGRTCSTEQIGCAKCHYHGACYSRDISATGSGLDSNENVLCECFPWYAGAYCQLNLKILLIALVAFGVLLLVLLLFCLLITCSKRRKNRRMQALMSGINCLPPAKTTRTVSRNEKLIKIDKRAMIKDTSSEASHSSDTLPYVAKENSNNQIQMHDSVGRMSDIERRCNLLDQNDRSLTVMIPRARYHPVTLQVTADSAGPLLSNNSTSEAKLLSYLDAGAQVTSNPPPPQRIATSSTTVKQHGAMHTTSTGALVSAGFEVSATVGSSQEIILSAAEIKQKSSKSQTGGGTNSILTGGKHSHYSGYKKQSIAAETDNAEFVDSMDAWLGAMQQTALTASEVRSYDETTIQPQTKSLLSVYERQLSQMNNDEANTMAERDVGSTFLLPHTHLYKPDRGSDDISGFDSF